MPGITPRHLLWTPADHPDSEPVCTGVERRLAGSFAAQHSTPINTGSYLPCSTPKQTMYRLMPGCSHCSRIFYWRLQYSPAFPCLHGEPTA